MLCREMSQGNTRYFQAPAKAQSGQLPVESAMPGTTLGTIQLQAFTSGGALYGEGISSAHLPSMLAGAQECVKICFCGAGDIVSTPFGGPSSDWRSIKLAVQHFTALMVAAHRRYTLGCICKPFALKQIGSTA